MSTFEDSDEDLPLITARSLLLGFFDLHSLSPDFDDWTEERLSDNPPRLFRLRQLMAMFRAFGLPWDPSAFTEGGFIQPEHPRYASLLPSLKNELLKANPKEMPMREYKGIVNDQLPDFFAILFDYRMCVDEVLSFSSGVLEASDLYLLAYQKAEALNKIIRSHVAAVEDTLTTLISPQGASFTVEQLVRDYGSPDVDVSEIDEEWM
ncbi:MAG: hypothetical protein FWF41_01280 [Betaproteobacteria bacterium]|nr:hypothetical protein [Betaproteobacteria bacterium]